MAYLNRLVSRNAQLARKRADEEARRSGRKMPWADVYTKIQSRLERRGAKKQAHIAERYPVDTISRTIRAYLNDERAWDLDWLEAFCTSVGTVPERMVSDSYDESKVSDASYAAFLSNALGRRLDASQYKRIASNLQQELDTPGMFELVADIADTLIEAKSEDEAVGAAQRLIRDSKIYTRNSGGKSATRKARKKPAK